MRQFFAAPKNRGFQFLIPTLTWYTLKKKSTIRGKQLPMDLAVTSLHISCFLSPGPDGIHPTLLRACASSLKTPLAMIYEESLKTGCLPPDWKKTNITPIHKSGKKNNASNYRPINLCSVPAKLMEGLVKDEVLRHLIDNELILSSQHGFLPGKSCTSNLLSYMNEVTAALDKGISFDVIMIDFRRAFDLVPFEHMLKKLEAHGIVGDVLRWITD